MTDEYSRVELWIGMLTPIPSHLIGGEYNGECACGKFINAKIDFR